MLCLAGALALAAASCKDEKTVTVQTICVNGLIYEVKTAIYAEEPADAEDEAAFELGLFPTEFTTPPEEEPDFYIGIDMSESLWGKTIDLSEPLDRNTHPWPYLYHGQKRRRTHYDRLRRRPDLRKDLARLALRHQKRRPVRRQTLRDAFRRTIHLRRLERHGEKSGDSRINAA